MDEASVRADDHWTSRMRRSRVRSADFGRAIAIALLVTVGCWTWGRMAFPPISSDTVVDPYTESAATFCPPRHRPDLLPAALFALGSVAVASAWMLADVD